MRRLWFKNKSYGWGWVPCSWEGWIILVAYVMYNVAVFRHMDGLSHSGSDTLMAWDLYFLGSTAILVALCYAKGERPRWRWGANLSRK